MDLKSLTEGTSTQKPWLTIVAKSVTADTISATTYSITTLEVKNDAKIGGYLSSLNDSLGSSILSTSTGTIVTPSQNGGNITYDPVLNKATLSGVAGQAPYSSSDGFATFTAITAPVGVNVPIIEYAPSLGYYSMVDAGGTGLAYTSPSAVTGSFTATPGMTGSTFSSDFLQWIPQVSRFFTQTSNTARRIAISSDGATYTAIASDRIGRRFAYSPELLILVAVGDNGPLWSTDGGLTFTNATSTTSMGHVSWSSFHKMFVAVPRGGTLTSIHYSLDGKNWIVATNSIANAVNIRCIIWIPQLMVFAAGGDGDSLYLSQTGFNFRRVANTAVAGYAAYGNNYIAQWGQYVQAGIGAGIRVSPRRFIS